MMLRTSIQIPSRSGASSPTSTAVSLSSVNVPDLKLSATILQSRPAVINSLLYADAVRQDVSYAYGYGLSPSPSQLHGLDVIEFFHQANSVLVHGTVPVHIVHSPPPNPQFCQEINSAGNGNDTAVNSGTGSSSPGASHSSTSASINRNRTEMCRNGPSCIWFKKNICIYAHREDEMRRFSLLELRETNKDFLSNLCFDFVNSGYW